MQRAVAIIGIGNILAGDDGVGSLAAQSLENAALPAGVRALDLGTLSPGAAKSLAPGQNATTVQVALGVVTAVMWMIENPKRGFCLPDDLPYECVLDIAKPYLGEFVSAPSDWTPLKNRNVYFKENPENRYDYDDVWQFKNFIFVR